MSEEPIQKNDVLYYPEPRYHRTVILSLLIGLGLGLLTGVNIGMILA